jgi:subtilase family serine protease/methionine-rich copper-binding protein CopC/type 1 glutamine amidotransferase
MGRAIRQLSGMETLEPRMLLSSVPFDDFVSRSPAGGMIYSGMRQDLLSVEDPADAFQISLDAGQTLTVVVAPEDGVLRPEIEVTKPSGFTDSIAAGAAGESAMLQATPVSESGLYTVLVSGGDGSLGSYSIHFTLNAAAESETWQGLPNDDRASAQELTDSFLTLNPAGSRGAVIGTLAGWETDWYEFELTDGQSATMAVARDDWDWIVMNLYDGSGLLLAVSSTSEEFFPVGLGVLGGSVWQPPVQAIHRFVDQTSDGGEDSYFLEVIGSSGDYGLVVTRDAEFDTNASYSPLLPTDLTGLGVALGATTSEYDAYAVMAEGDGSLNVGALIPADGSGEFANGLVPLLEVYNADGTLLGGAGAYPTIAGPYAVVVSPGTSPGGEYVLSVAGDINGDSSSLFPFEVDDWWDSTSLPNAVEITVAFSDTIYVPSLDASDLYVLDGPAAVDVWTPDGRTAVFTFAEDLPDGYYLAQIDAGAILDVQGQPVESFSFEFIRQTPPRVVNSSVSGGEILEAGTDQPVFSFEFDEPLDAESLNDSDFSLVGFRSGPIPVYDWWCESNPPTLFLDFGREDYVGSYRDFQPQDDIYTLTLVSGGATIRDLDGWSLDGDNDGWPGGDFVLQFSGDSFVWDPLPELEPKHPRGSLIYDLGVGAVIGNPGDVDTYTIELDADQTVSLVLDPSSTLQPVVELIRLDDWETLGHAEASQPGESVVLQPVEIDAAGTYAVSVWGGSFEFTVGQYTLNVILNAQLEAESVGGAANDGLAGAEDLAASVIPLPGQGDRAAVLGAFVSHTGDLTEDNAGRWSVSASDDAESLLFDDPARVRSGSSSLRLETQSGFDVAWKYPATENADWDLSAGGLIQASFYAENPNFSFQGSQPWFRLYDGESYIQLMPDAELLNNARNQWLDLSIPLEGGVSGEVTWTRTESGSVDLTSIDSIEFHADTWDYGFTLWTDGLRLPVAETPDADWYRLELADGQSVSLALSADVSEGLTLEFYDGLGQLLAIATPAENAELTINNVVDLTDEGSPADYYVRVQGQDGAYRLVVTRDADFDTEANDSSATAQDISGIGAALGWISGTGLTSSVSPFTALQPDEDFYRVRGLATDVLAVAVIAPGADPGQLTNDLQPTVEVLAFEPDGGELGSPGTHTLRVSAATPDGGEYLLTVSGASLGFAPFTVVESDPAEDAETASAIPEITLTFSDTLLLTALDPEDFTIDGQAPGAVTLVDGRTVRLVSADPLAEGPHTVEIAGQILDVQGTELEPFTLNFTSNFNLPRVETSSVLEGDSLAPGRFVYNATFNKELDITVLDASDVALVGAATGLHSPVSGGFEYDLDTDTLTVDFGDLPEDAYTLRLFSGDGRFEDVAGNGLDGEPDPTTTVPSGDGFVGGDFVVHFGVDVTGIREIPVPLAAKFPLGSLIYDPPANGVIGPAVDVDAWTMEVDSGQTITVVVEPDGSLRPSVTLVGPDSDTATAHAAAAGEAAILQTVVADAPGTYTITVSGLEASVGAYTVRVILNAAREAEGLGSTTNDSRADAEDIDGSFLSLTGGSGQRGAILGTLPAGISDVDWHSFTLALNQRVTLAVTGQAEGRFTLDLYDPAGEQLARAIPGGTNGNVDQLIRGYQATAAGTYYAVVSGDGEYSLVVTRSMELDIEPNTRTNDAQWLTPAQAVVGSLGRNEEGGRGGTIRVALLNNGYMTANVQLADDTYFDFDPVLVNASQIDTVQELDAFDVVVIGDQSSRSYLQTIAPALRAWVEAGGGVVGTGWLVYAAGTATGTPIADIDAIIPVNTSGSYGYRGSSFTLTVTDQNHPVTEGVDSFYISNGYSEYQSADPGATLLANISGQPAVVVKEPGAGRAVYLGPVYSESGANYPLLKSGDADQLFEQAVAWAARGGKDTADQYLIAANSGNNLTITTTTPGDGPYEPGNDLDPLLELYDPAGTLVASNNNWSFADGGDGRNARIVYTVAEGAGGTYRVRISPVLGSGDYTLQVAGAIGARVVPLTVTAVSIADGATLTAWPGTLQLDFNSPLLLTSVQAGDLTVNGTPADRVTVIDGNTLEFDITGSHTGDGPYTIEVAQDVLENLFASANTAFSLSFTLDTTSPVVTASSIDDGEIIEPGDWTYTVTFSEDLATSGLGLEDVTLVENTFGTAFAPTTFNYDAQTDTLSVGFHGLYDGSYTLRLISGPDAFRDLVGNALNGAPGDPLPSGQGDPAADDFVLNFVVDAAGNLAYPVPLTPKTPLGSLIFDPSVRGAIHVADDSDGYAVSLDAGQTVTVLMTAGEDLQGSIELRAPDGTSLATAIATMPNEEVVLQTVPASAAGTYQLLIGGVASTTGGYTARLILNAAVEMESHGGASNDDLASAQDLSGSLLDLGGGVQRAAVLGDVRTALSSTVTRLSGSTYGTSLSTLVDGVFRPRGTAWYDGTVYWSDIGTQIELALASPETIDGARVQADNNDAYQLDWYDASDGTWKPLWTVPNYSDRGISGMITRPDYPLTDSDEFHALAEPVTTDKLRLRAVSGDGSYSVSEIQLLTRGDLYSLVLAEGQAASSVLTAMGAGSLSLDLLDNAGTSLAVGLAGYGNVSRAISDFVAPAAGTYYWRVSGDGAYSLAITRDAAFDLEANDTADTAQGISTTGAVLGHLWQTASEGFESGEFPLPGWSTYNSTSSGRGRVTDLHGAAAGSYALVMDSSSGWALNEAIWTVDLAGATAAVLSFQHRSFGSETNSSLASSFTGHYFADGASFSPNGTNWYRLWSPVLSTAWATVNVDLVAQAAAHGIALNDRVQVKFQQYDQYASPSGGRAWDNISIVTDASEDHYLVQVAEGDALRIVTTTPGDGVGEPVNTLVPRIELFAPDGSSLGSNDGGAPDGRNALLMHTATVGGPYRIRVTPLSGAGAYTMRVEGATGAETLHVLASLPADGSRLAAFPSQVRVDLSAGVLLTSFQPSDLQITRPDSTVLPAGAVSLVDGDTLAFTLTAAEAGDGPYRLQMAAGSLTGVSGTPLEAFEATFELDTTGPVVVGTSIPAGGTVNSGLLTWTVTFNEDMATSGLGPEDVTLAGEGLAQNADTWVYDGGSRSLTATFLDVGEGDYTLTLASSVTAWRDVVDNLLDGDADGTPGDPFTLSFTVETVEVPLATPLTALEPPGALIYTQTQSGAFAQSADQDTFTVPLDAGQTATALLRPLDASIQARVELRGPDGSSLGTAQAAAAGQTVILQTVPVAETGTYSIDLLSMAGGGAYEVQLVLNARLEAEMYGADPNDSLLGAESLAASAVPLDSGSAQRLGVVGRTDSAAAGTPDYFAFEMAAGQFATLALTADSGADIQLQLRDATDAILAHGTSDGLNISRYIGTFLAPVAGLYYARVSGAADAFYTLLVTRDADFDREPNDDQAPSAQELTATRVALGALSGRVITSETEPNGSVATANDWSASFLHIGANQYRASVTGTISAGNNGDWDYYKIRVSQGDALRLDLEGSPTGKGTLGDTYLYLYSSTGQQLAANDDGGAGYNSLLNWTAFPWATGDYYVVADSYGSGVGTYTLTATLTTANLLMSGGQDYYSVRVNAGDALTVRTLTPGGELGEFVNEVDPLITLYDPVGTQVAADDNSADGRNAQLTHTAARTGVYSIKVAGATYVPGEYVLQVSGSTGTLPPLTILATTPADGALLNAYPSTYRLDFSAPLLLTSLTADDVTVDGVPAGGLTVVDADTIEFDIAAADTGDGMFQVEIAAGAITSLSGQPLQAFAATFDYDATDPWVAGSSVSEGEVLAPGSLVYQVTFSEELATADLGGEDVTLVESLSGAAIAASAFAYDPASSTATVTYSVLDEGLYTLTLLTSATAFRDRRGNLLDGTPSFPLPSGDGAPGDPFVVHFQVDRTTAAFPVPLPLVAPAGGLIHAGSVAGVLNATGDMDAFAVSLDPGQTASVTLAPQTGSVQARLELFAPDFTSLGEVDASAAGQTIWLQTLPVAAGGTYRIEVTSLAGAGGFDLDLTLNAAIEEESLGGTGNNDLAGAQDLAAAWIEIGDGSQRAAALGTADGAGGTADLYRVDLDAGDFVTWTLTGQGSSQPALEVLDAAGTVLALGAGGAANIGQSVADFVVPAGGAYYARVKGSGDYSLVVVRNTDFELADYSYFADFQSGVGAEWSTNVTDNSSATFTRFLGRFNHSSATLTLPTVPGRAYALEFDLMIIDSWDGGASDYLNVDVAGSQVFHHTFNQFGGAQTYPGTPAVSGQNYGWSGWNDSIYRRISIPFVASSTSTAIRFYDSGLQELSDESWGLDNVRVREQDIGLTGRVLGYYDSGLDQYHFVAEAGNALNIYTTTPGDGAGEPVNTFDPYLQLYGPAGLLVALDDDGGPQNDGRNAGIAFTVPEGGGGTYTLRVQGSGSGAYTLNVAGATGTASPLPDVVSTTPAEGQRFAAPPASLDLTFSEWLRVDTLDVNDLTLDGGATVTGMQVIDGRTVRFLLDVPDVEATYTYTLAATSVLDLQGGANPAYQGTFLIDKTGPRVVAQVPAQQTSAPFAQLTFVFDEAIAPLSFTTSDITQFTGPGGTSLMAQLTGVNVAGNQATVTFNAQAAQGTYVMQIGPNIEDLVENKMDQNGNGTKGEASDYYLATVDLQSADLTVTAVDLPAAAVFGAPLTFSWTVLNSGTDPAVEGWKDQAWLSTDATYSANDIALLATPVSPPDGTVPLGVNVPYTQTVTVNLPLSASLGGGIYYILVKADSQNQQPENNENNNFNSESLSISLPPLPDLVVSSISAPIEGFSGQTIQYSWTVTNQGTGPASGTWSDRVLLSDDTSVGNDVHLGDFSFTGTIAAGQSITRTQTYTLPIALEGDRWFIVQTDRGNQLYEHTNEGNNTRVSNVPMTVQLSPFPNLQVTSVVPPAEAFSSQQAVVEWVVANNGTGSTSAPVWYDRVWLSTDNVWDGADTYLGQVANPSYLNPNDSYVSSLTVTLPQGIQGDYWFIVQTDVNNQVYEHNRENDNIGVGPKTRVTLTPPPDLRVTNIQGPDQVFSNQTVTVTWTVLNDDATPGAGGRTLQTSWYDRVYLSSSPDGMVNAFSLGTASHSGALDAGESYTRSLPVTIPIQIEGPWYFHVAADNGNQVFEHIFEGNNRDVRRDQSLQPRPTEVTMTPPDLEVDFVGAPANAQASHPFSFTYRVTNHGVAATPNSSWSDAYYLSADTTLDAGDLQLGSLTHYGALDVSGATNDSYTRTVTYTLPNGLTGDYYVLVKTDSANVVFEGPAGSPGETNNVTASTVAVQVVSNPPDLVIVPGSFEPWATAQAGSFLRASWGVLNQGTGATVGGTWKCKVYVSLDGIKGNSDDRLLATFVRNGDLAAGDSYYAIDRQVNIPIDLEGTIYLYVRTDTDNQVYEGANENNNDSGLVPVTIVQHLGDLQVTALDPLAGPITGGDWVTVHWTVENLGTGRTDALSWRDRIYLSPDNVLGNGNDRHLGSVTRTSPLDSGGAYAASASVQIPTDVSGPFYLGVWTDADGAVFEGLLENNNTRLVNLGTIEPPPPGTALVPDLVLVNVDAPAQAYSGQAFSLHWTVRNGGDPTPRNWYDQVYLSLDQVLDLGTDISLGHVYHDSLGTGASYTQTQSFNIPRGLSGPFYVFVTTDRGNYLNESNELNNADYDRTSMLVQLVPPADLVVGTITVPANASPGMNATLTYTVHNQGDDAALGSWYDSIYISADTVWDIDDAFFGRVYHEGNVAGHGGSYSHSLTAPLPGVLPGEYHVIVRSDIRNQIPESDETNNLGASLDRVDIDAQLLELGEPQTGNLAQGRAVYYKTEVLTAGETVRLRFDGDEEAFSELYVRYGSMPSRNQYDRAAIQPFVSDQEIVLPVEQTGVYYVMAYATGASGAPQYTISAEIIPFSILGVQASRVGNSGNATVKVSGARFREDTGFFVLDSQLNALPAERVYLQDTATAFVTFDLFQVPPAVYTVGAYDPGQDTLVLLEESLTVVAGTGYNIDTLGTGPAVVAPNRNYRFDVHFGNDGDGDAMAPLLIATGITNTPLGFSPGAIPRGLRCKSWERPRRDRWISCGRER